MTLREKLKSPEAVEAVKVALTDYYFSDNIRFGERFWEGVAKAAITVMLEHIQYDETVLWRTAAALKMQNDKIAAIYALFSETKPEYTAAYDLKSDILAILEPGMVSDNE